ncbi:hypothetical protein D0Y65_050959 [Glycine soja]|uniref:Uncharacterized protein n=1 Tax=Glycine soja TaxID=3848 RepID=A0A445FEA0_GLYSO|nr:hypothetical protein D0Y65_050959 [Glycine soja]
MTITLQDVATILGFPIVDDEIPSLFDQPFVDLRCSFNRSTNGYPYFITTHPLSLNIPSMILCSNWFLQLWITMYFPMFVVKRSKTTKPFDCHAKDPIPGESHRIKSTTSGSTHFFIEIIFGILDEVGALWNPPIIDHVVLDWLKMDPLANSKAKAIQTTN